MDHICLIALCYAVLLFSERIALGWHWVNHAWLGREVALSVSEAVKKLLLTHPSQTRIFHTFSSKWGIGYRSQLVISAIIGYCFRFHSRLSSCLKLNIGIGHKRGEVVKLNIGIGHKMGEVVKSNIPEREVVKLNIQYQEYHPCVRRWG